ncbi:hypothetical protein Sjap_022525 [Stephania japonica]|uniref:Peptidase metallopeptidase domain-containing protein n=1 Tax=Stephania japonica TaxID=461633 RepID=A0AAP0EWA6_9MAGN
MSVHFDHLLLLIITTFYFFNPNYPSSLAARPLPSASTPAFDNNHNQTWQEFESLVDAKKGSCVAGMSKLKSYFHQFGYLPKTPNKNFTDVFDNTLEYALTRYQSRQGLPITGKLDSITLSHVVQPRCGVSDTATFATHPQPSRLGATYTKRFAYFPGKPRWARPSSTNLINLTYAFSRDNINMIDYLSFSDVRAVFQRAFVRWASVIPVSFTEVEEYRTADIKIGFYRGEHGDGEPFDGVLGVLAHSFSPESGMFHLDAAETWAVDFGSEKSRVAIDLESVATHEIGHLLGLAHTTVKEAVMYATLGPRTRKVDLRLDDVAGVQALYGSNPNSTYNSLIESYTSDSFRAVGFRSILFRWVAFVVLAFLF